MRIKRWDDVLSQSEELKYKDKWIVKKQSDFIKIINKENVLRVKIMFLSNNDLKNRKFQMVFEINDWMFLHKYTKNFDTFDEMQLFYNSILDNVLTINQLREKKLNMLHNI